MNKFIRLIIQFDFRGEIFDELTDDLGDFGEKPFIDIF